MSDKIHIADALDWRTFEFECPRCRFYNTIFVRDVKLRFRHICRGCKMNLQLEDYWASYKRACERLDSILNKSLEELAKSFSFTITL